MPTANAPAPTPPRTAASHVARTTALRASAPTPLDRSLFFSPAKLTREGKVFFGIAIGVGVAALNTGNNLLFLMFGLLLALLLLSLVISHHSLQQLSVIRRLPIRAHVGSSHVVEIEVINHKKYSPSYAVEVEDLREKHPADKRCFFLKISANSTQVAAYRRTPKQRGAEQHTGFRLATRFPFGLFERSIELPARGELLIYPAIDPVQLPRRDARRSGSDGGRHAARGDSEDFLGVRPWRDGEDPRDIHWRKSASLGRPVLRERRTHAAPEVQLFLETRAREGGEDAAQFERRVREVASRAVAHVRRGDAVVLRTSAGAKLRCDRQSGADNLLRFLAFVSQESGRAT